MDRAAVAVPPSCPVIVAEVVACTEEVVTVKLAVVCPPATSTLCGTVAVVVLLDRNTAAPPDGAAIFSETVPVEELPPVTEPGSIVNDETESVAAVPQKPGVPPPPQIWPKSHPQVIVPPHPSAIAPHVPGVTSKQLLGAQPPVTVSGFVTGA
jgi:hypothetical protein